MHALQVIEWDAVRRQLAQECHTALGEKAAASLLPAFEPERAKFLAEQTREAYDLLAMQSVSLVGVRDLHEAATRAQKGGSLDATTLYGVAESLRAMRGAKGVLEPRQQEYPKLWLLGRRLPVEQRIEERLYDSVDGDGEVRDSASPSLASIRGRKAKAAQRMLERIQSYTSGRTRELLSDTVYTQRDGRYVIPLKAENRGKIKGIVHDTSGSGQTIYVEPEDVVQLGNQLREAQAAEREEVERVLAELSELVGGIASDLKDGVEASGDLDLVLAKARHGVRTHGCLPLPATGPYVRIVGGRHALLDPETVVPLTVEVGGDGPGRLDALLITGPNTGGKTVAIKTVGLCVAMGQAGMMPPADEMRLGCFSQIWADIGDEQSLQQSLSTFSGHIKNIAGALQGLKPGALVLLDEIGAGTDPGEGAALARALLLAFQAAGAKVMASTHYGELKILASNTPGFLNAAMEFDLKTLRPTYHLQMGMPGSSHALKIAERYGVPKVVIDEAKSGIAEEELDVARMIEKLELAQRQAQKAQGEADRLAAQLRKVQRETEGKLAEAQEAKREAKAKATEELELALREIRLEAADIFDELKAGASQSALERARERLKGLQAAGGSIAEEMRPEPVKRAPAPKPASLKRGMSVRVSGLGQVGTLLEEPKGKNVMVQIGPMKMSVALDRLEAVAQPAKSGPRSRGTGAMLQRAQTAHTEISLRAMRAEDAMEELSRFMDDAVLAGLESVRIVHGKGEGILRKLTHDYLRKNRNVREYHLAEPAEGGDGVTVATLK